MRTMSKSPDSSTDSKSQAAGPLDGTLAGQVKASAQQIWLAGMGAFARAQAEGGKVFEALVKEGATLQKKTQAVAEDRFGDVGQQVTRLAGEVQAKAGQQWDRLESLFEERTAKALGHLGVPSAAEVQALGARLDALSLEVTRLATLAASRATPARRAAKPKAPGAAVKRRTPRSAPP
jgi:poly(hydroxyalkanoate) granule-associated protein